MACDAKWQVQETGKVGIEPTTAIAPVAPEWLLYPIELLAYIIGLTHKHLSMNSGIGMPSSSFAASGFG